MGPFICLSVLTFLSRERYIAQTSHFRRNIAFFNTVATNKIQPALFTQNSASKLIKKQLNSPPTLCSPLPFLRSGLGQLLPVSVRRVLVLTTDHSLTLVPTTTIAAFQAIF